jgi:diapolycopene oxygenase
LSNVIIIGSGLGGLTAACTLAARGYRVKVFEKNDWTGGKACVLEEKGFRFDMGPTILTIPSVLKKVFEEAGEKMEDHLDLVRLDPQWRSFFADRSVLDLTEDLAKMKENIREFTREPDDVQNYERFLVEAQRLHDITKDYFFWKPVGDVFDIMDPKAMLNLSSLKSFLAMRPHQSVSSCVRSFVKDERTAQMLDHFVQYVGSSPEQSPAVLCGIAHMQTQEGVWYPMGGTRAVPVELRKLAERMGVEFHTGVRITSIRRGNEGVAGVQDDQGRDHWANAVISNMDSVRTHRELLKGRPLANFEARREYEPACSGVVLYLGLNRRYDQLAHHDFVFSRDPEEEFHHIYELGEPAPDPSAYIAAPAITDPSVAPEGGDALYVLVHTPYLRPHHDWSKMLPEYRKVIFKKLADAAGMDDLEDRIEFEAVLTPQDIHDRYAVLNGAIYGLASHGKVTGAFKPTNRSPDVPGLYLAGGAAHPGPGMPMAMMSGWIAADALDQDGRVEKGRAAAVASA